MTTVEYAEYVQGVRQEYSHVTAEQWKVGRPAVLKSLLSGPGLFLSPHFKPSEEKARQNIAKEIETITSM